MSYVVNSHPNNLYVLSNKAVGPGKNPKLINVESTSILEAEELSSISHIKLIEIRNFTSLRMYESTCHYILNRLRYLARLREFEKYVPLR